MRKPRKTGPSRKPTSVRRTSFDSKELVDVWFYESKRGVEIFHRRRNAGREVVFGPTIRIPWSQLRRSAKRCASGSEEKD